IIIGATELIIVPSLMYYYQISRGDFSPARVFVGIKFLFFSFNYNFCRMPISFKTFGSTVVIFMTVIFFPNNFSTSPFLAFLRCSFTLVFKFPFDFSILRGKALPDSFNSSKTSFQLEDLYGNEKLTENA
ncbi:hypothetical protein L9F63_021747, partial [Diploptera punctata]